MRQILLIFALFLSLNADIINKNITEFDFANSDYILVDVRTPSEYKQTGVVKNAILIPLINDDGKFNENFIKSFEKYDKNTKIALMCRSGSRSTRAMKLLKEFGFINLLNLDGGINALQKTNIKLVPYKN